jgi:transposase
LPATASPSTIPATSVLSIPPQLPNDVESLKSLVHQLHEALHKSVRENDQLQHRLAMLLKARFGPRADRLDPNQMLLFATEMMQVVEQSSTGPRPKKPANGQPKREGHGRRRFPEDLPRLLMVHDLSEDQKRCPGCGEMRTKIGEERSEQLELEPAKLYVIQHIRPTYACRKCAGNVETASKPLQPIERGLAGPGLLAQVITAKFGDHLPLYRQEDILQRSGHAIPRSTTCGWVASCASLVRPLYDLMTGIIRQSKVINTDDTTVPVLDPKRGKTREGRIWVYVGDQEHPYTVFDYTPTRCRDGPEQFFGPYAGYIQADAYGGYDFLFKPRGEGVTGPTELGCWAHGRRYFVEAEQSDVLRSHTMVAMIKLLYEVESEAKELDADARHTLRQEKSVPILARIKAWLDQQKDQVLPKSPMSKAISYCLSNWDALLRYTQDGDLAIDNNAAENALRPIVLGRKNWLFAGSDNGGRTGAILASLVASCKRHGVDPYAYLKDLLTRIAATPISQLDQFLPDRWKAARLAADTSSRPSAQ